MAVNAAIVDFEVRWGECDPAGIVYHPNYLDWFSVSRMHLFRENGLPYMQAFHERGVVLVVLDVQCRFHKVLRAEDKVQVRAELLAVSRTRMSVEYQVFDENGHRCADGQTHHAFVDMDQRPVNVAKRCPDLWAILSTWANHAY